MPRVFNKYHRDAPPGAVSIMRPSPLGNPFVIGKDGTRAEVVAKHREWIGMQPRLLALIATMRGCDLVCCCKPHECHGDTILELANPPGGAS